MYEYSKFYIFGIPKIQKMFPKLFTMKWLTGKFWKLYYPQSIIPSLPPSHKKIHTHTHTTNPLFLKSILKWGSPG